MTNRKSHRPKPFMTRTSLILDGIEGALCTGTGAAISCSASSLATAGLLVFHRLAHSLLCRCHLKPALAISKPVCLFLYLTKTEPRCGCNKRTAASTLILPFLKKVTSAISFCLQGISNDFFA